MSVTPNIFIIFLTGAVCKEYSVGFVPIECVCNLCVVPLQCQSNTSSEPEFVIAEAVEGLQSTGAIIRNFLFQYPVAKYDLDHIAPDLCRTSRWNLMNCENPSWFIKGDNRGHLLLGRIWRLHRQKVAEFRWHWPIRYKTVIVCISFGQIHLTGIDGTCRKSPCGWMRFLHLLLPLVMRLSLMRSLLLKLLIRIIL